MEVVGLGFVVVVFVVSTVVDLKSSSLCNVEVVVKVVVVVVFVVILLLVVLVVGVGIGSTLL